MTHLGTIAVPYLLGPQRVYWVNQFDGIADVFSVSVYCYCSGVILGTRSTRIGNPLMLTLWARDVLETFS